MKNQMLFLLCSCLSIHAMEKKEPTARQFIPNIIELSNRTGGQIFIMDKQELHAKVAGQINVNSTDKDDGKLWFSYNGEYFTLCYPHGKAASGPYTAKIDIKTACYLLKAKEIPPSAESYSAVQFFNDTDKMLLVTHPDKEKGKIDCDEIVYKGVKSEPIITTFSFSENEESDTVTIPLTIEGKKHSVICLNRAKETYINHKNPEADTLTLYAQTIALLANGYELKKGLPQKQKTKSWFSCVMQ